MLQTPTDNLYKFLAIFGLVVIVLSVYIPLQKLEALDRNTMQIRPMYKPLVDHAKAADDAARVELSCAIQDAQQDDKNKNIIGTEDCAGLKEAQVAFSLANDEVTKIFNKLSELESEHDFLVGQYLLYRNLGIASGAIGLVICALGFWLWYTRLQKFLDAAARQDARNL